MTEDERPRKMQKLNGNDEPEISAGTTSNHVEKPTEETQQNAEIATSAATGAAQPLPDGGENGQATVHEASLAPASDNATPEGEQKPLSKNARKRLAKAQKWEEGREWRKSMRKQKSVERREKKRAEKKDEVARLAAEGLEPPKPTFIKPVQVPITIIFDCDFDNLMLDKEIISLGSQITRAYSDNKNSKFRANMVFSSFGGKLKERFEGPLAGHYKSWKGTHFTEEDFVAASEEAKNRMKNNKVVGALAKSDDASESIQDSPSNDKEGEVIYLSSDSDTTLTELKPYSTYIIGGLVDKNRHKGICHKRAVERGIKTAKLPIGEYLQMASRFVLATNHVSEIMVRWLELGDWGEAFISVLPKRKGGVLKAKDEAGEGKEEVNVEPSSDDNDNEEEEEEQEAATAAANDGKPTIESAADQEVTHEKAAAATEC